MSSKPRFVLSKNDIKEFPFQEYKTAEPTELESLAEHHYLKAHNTWMLPQLLAYWGSFKVQKDDAGKCLAAATLKANVSKNDWAIGTIYVANKLKRSSLIKAQANAQFAEYSALVPLILAGIKKYQNIPYSAWSTEGLNHIVDPNLYEAMTCDYKGNLTPERLYQLRVEGLTVKSGPKLGEVKKATSQWCLTGVQTTEIGDLPKLAQTMLTQIWVADPTLRSPYMVLDPNDWDAMPDPLIPTEVVAKKFYKPSPYDAYVHPEGGDNPWD